MNNALIELKNVTQHFTVNEHTITPLQSINASFLQGISYAITGTSGSGKSTLMHIIAGINRPSSGSVIYNNNALHTLSEKALCYHRATSIGLIFQSSYIVPELSVLENVMLPGLILNKEKKALQQKAYDILEYLNIAEKNNHMPKTLSGGQQQRLALARALINDPTFLIADEPTGNLDHETEIRIIDLIINCQKEWGMGIIISSHNPYVTQRMNEHYELSNGTLKKVI